MESLLFIEDDDGIRLALSLALEDEGYSVREAANGTDGLAAFEQRCARPRAARPPSARHVRASTCAGRSGPSSIVPIIIITAQTDTHDMVAGLEAGADDYVTKPVVPKELAARIRALLRRVHLHGAAPLASVSSFGDIELRRELGLAYKGGKELNLTKTEFRLLCEFADHAGAVLSRDQLLERVWGYEYLGDSRLVDAHVRRLRLKVEDQPDEPTLIVTARGVGYRLIA